MSVKMIEDHYGHVTPAARRSGCEARVNLDEKVSPDA